MFVSLEFGGKGASGVRLFWDQNGGFFRHKNAILNRRLLREFDL